MDQKTMMGELAEMFAYSPLDSLVAKFNATVGRKGMTCAAMMRDRLLMEEFIRRGIDITEVCDGDRLSFKHTVVLDESRTKLCIENDA
ncbi:MAG: hypothetical protein MJZ35_06980 [Bacteroidaceae bacterium]|nr:hypothetical protein [Bacteroidaceae bacterium]